MWTNAANGRDLVAELTRAVVADVGPEELALFDALLADYLRNPARQPPGREDPDDPLGSGLGAIALITPAAAAMVIATLQFVGVEGVTAAREEAVKVIKRRVAALFGSDGRDAKPAPLDREQLAQVRRLASKEAESFGLPPATAEQMAKVLVGALALARPK